MSRKIGFANKKGGVGKTTSIVNIATYLALANNKVLLIDLDTQGNASLLLGITPYLNLKGISAILNESNNSLEEVIIKTKVPNLYILPADTKINELELILRKEKLGVTFLAEKIKQIETSFNFILVDFPPSLSLLTLNGFFYIKEVIIPIQTNYLSLDGLLQMTRLIYRINAKMNPDLKITAVLPTMCDLRTKMHYEVMQKLKTIFEPEKILPFVHLNVKLAEIGKYKKPIALYAPHSQGAKDYLLITKKIISQKKF